jgi:7-cyano-7-deazaguanine tRNA-ribosyltransferase
MIMTAKMNLPIDKPLHLFGAGHPFMFALAVALGCDLFDSAAYAIYARENRYMTENGTHRLSELDYFPCTCPKCLSATPKQALELSQEERTAFLAEHNLYVCAAELKRIKQAIKDGRLWEHLEMRAYAHPALLQAVKKLPKYEEFMEKHAPTVKDSGLFFFNSVGLSRPEVVHYRKNLKERYTKPKQAKILLLMPQTRTKPFHKSQEYKQIAKIISDKDKVHACFYDAPFGVVPIELDEVYPLSQHETSLPLDKDTVEYVANQVAHYISRGDYEKVVLIDDQENWNKTILNACRNTCRQKKIKFEHINIQKTNSARLRLELKF